MELRNLTVTNRFVVNEEDYTVYVTELQSCLYRGDVYRTYTGIKIFKTPIFTTLKEALNVVKDYLDMKKEA